MGVNEYQSRWATARCVGLTKEESDKVFFPTAGRPRKVPPHKQFCDGCVIKNFCLSYAIVHDEEGTWGGMTRTERDSLGPNVKEKLTVEAKYQGWYEERKTVDEILADVFEQPLELEEELYISTLPPLSEFDFQPVYTSQIQLTFDKPEDQLPEVPHLLNFDNGQQKDSSVSLFGFPSALLGSY